MHQKSVTVVVAGLCLTHRITKSTIARRRYAMTTSKKMASLLREIFSWPTLVTIAFVLFLVGTMLKNVPPGRKLFALGCYGIGAAIGACLLLIVDWYSDRNG